MAVESIPDTEHVCFLTHLDCQDFNGDCKAPSFHDDRPAAHMLAADSIVNPEEVSDQSCTAEQPPQVLYSHSEAELQHDEKGDGLPLDRTAQIKLSLMCTPRGSVVASVLEQDWGHEKVEKSIDESVCWAGLAELAHGLSKSDSNCEGDCSASNGRYVVFDETKHKHVSWSETDEDNAAQIALPTDRTSIQEGQHSSETSRRMPSKGLEGTALFSSCEWQD